MFCPTCGKELQGSSPQFCMSCGAEQPAQPDASAGSGSLAGGFVVTPNGVPDPSDRLPVRADTPTGSMLELGRVDVGMVTFLSTITLGIYFMVWLYKAMRMYRTLSGRAGANLEQYFWGTVIAVGAAIVLSLLTGFLGLLAITAAIVLEALLINEVIKDRDAAAPLTARAMLPSAGLLVTLAVLSNVVSLTVCGLLVGIPLAIWFYYQFFTGHNRLIEARAQESPWPGLIP